MKQKTKEMSNIKLIVLFAISLISYDIKALDEVKKMNRIEIKDNILIANSNPLKDTLNNRNKTSENTFFGEGLGLGGLFSVNYERFISKNYASTTYIRNGIGVKQTIESGFIYNDPTFLFAVTNITGIKKHHLETGFGFTLVSGLGDIYLNFLTGYRFQIPNGGVLVRANVNVMYNTFESLLLFVPSISLGCAF